VDYDLIAFDLSKCERSSRMIRGEHDKLIRVADKLASAVADVSTWWDGDSKYSFIRRANELESLMRRAAGLILEMSENMTKSAEYKIAVDQQLGNEALKPVTVNIQMVQ